MDEDQRRHGDTRPGGRTARTREAALRAVLEELVERGLGALSIDGVAQRSGIHKTTLYRRWGGLDALLADAATTAMDDAVPIPDTGGLDTDLHALAALIGQNLRHPVTRALVRVLASKGDRSTWVREASATFWRHRAELTGTLVERGVARGELPADTDRTAVLETLIAPLYLRLLVTGQPLDGHAVRATAERTAALGRAGLLTAPDSD